jgi:ATP-binding cassette subfamily B (MDR/TAP) protein 1
MPIPWFDTPKNHTGGLAARLSSDCQIVNGMTTTYLSILVSSISTLVAGIIIAFVFEWRTTLTALGLMPFMMASGAIRAKFKTGQTDQGEEMYKQSSILIMESTSNVRTVISFGV